jgi:alginate O-acetyltransferase complex protein AlgI
MAAVPLLGASFIFYGWFVPQYLILLLSSAIFNFLISKKLFENQNRNLLFFSVAVNLLNIAFFKYLDFLITSANTLFQTSWPISNIILPLAISFFTFQQIAYLVDISRKQAEPPSLLEYLLFVSFFPQLIAGPIVHHKEIIPQLRSENFVKITSATVLLGLLWFSIGLFKKTMIADQLSPISDNLFGMAALGEEVTFFEAWIGVLAFSFQIYYDFSAYSDMAIGLAIIFGIVLPINFNSPYRATSIISFWRRWHITLSTFLRDYLYIPLGGNRLSTPRRYVNLFLTMILGGLWHGAAWTFVVWGGLHGFFLAINHTWRALGGSMPRVLGWLLTTVAVLFAWTFFRAESIASGVGVLEGLIGLNGAVLAAEHRFLFGELAPVLQMFGVEFEGLPAVRIRYFLLFPLLFLLVLAFPPTHQIFGHDVKNLTGKMEFSNWKIFASGIALALGVIGVGSGSEFIYFQF